MEGACLCTLFLKYGFPAIVTTLVIGITYFLNKIGFFYVLTHKVDVKSPRHGGELVAEVLKSHGVDFIFTLVGGHISPILVASEKKGIRVVDVRHEVSAVFAADAVARLSGKVGVAAVTAGPGLTNTVTAIKNAQMAESPILLIGGAAAGILKGRGALQDIDQMVLFKPLCKYTATIRSCREIIPTLRKALQEAQSGVPGPVFVEFPIDTLYPCELVKKEIGAKDGGSGKSLFQKIAAWYLDLYMRNIFSGAWDKRDVSPLPVHQPRADSKLLDQAADIIRNSKKPVILLGSQATLPPVPATELRDSLETLGIPCFLGGMTRGLLGRDNPIHIRQRRRDALSEADVVIMAGAVADFRLSYGRVLKRKSKIIAINRSKEQLFKNTDMFWKPTVAAISDVATFIVGLQRRLGSYRASEEWAKTLKDRDVAKETANEKKGLEETEKHLNPINVLHRIEKLLPDNAILVADGGDFVGTAAYIVRPRGPLTWLDPGAFGTLGVGGGFALGAKLVRPDSEVWIIYGDGSLGYSVAEMDTYTRFKTPVICLVGNDACWSQIAREQVPMFKSSVACDLDYSAYETVADGYGGKGYRIDRTNIENLEDIVKEAREYAKNGKSSLLNVLIGKTNFREGSISV